MSERDQFEAWARDHEYILDQRNGQYRASSTYFLWVGWQAARATPQPAAVPELADQRNAAIRVMAALEDEAKNRRTKYGSAIYSARDVDPDVYDIARCILAVPQPSPEPEKD